MKSTSAIFFASLFACSLSMVDVRPGLIAAFRLSAGIELVPQDTASRKHNSLKVHCAPEENKEETMYTLIRIVPSGKSYTILAPSPFPVIVKACEAFLQTVL